MEPDPVQIVEPRSLQDLFDDDPLRLSDRDIDTIVATYRAQRANFIVEEAKPKAARIAKEKPEPKGRAAALANIAATGFELDLSLPLKPKP